MAGYDLETFDYAAAYEDGAPDPEYGPELIAGYIMDDPTHAHTIPLSAVNVPTLPDDPCWCSGPWIGDDMDLSDIPESVLMREHRGGAAGCWYAPRKDVGR